MVRVLELFAGIGACSKALARLGIEHEIVDAVEIDKYAIKSFNAIHGTNFEPQDITQWDKDIKVDLIMHGSPCQDFSVAGLNKGGDKGSGTRSSLMYETLRIVEKLKPKYVIWENVKNLLSKKHRHNFDAYIEAMDKLGYHSQYQVLNAKNFGVPQNRERVFTVSIRNDLNVGFKFPNPIPLEHRLKDILENNVDERYYLSDEQVSRIKLSSFNQARGRIQESDVSQTLCARDYKDPKCVRVGGLYDKDGSRHQAGSIYDPNGVCATLSTMQGGNQEPIIVDDTYKNREPREYEDYSPTLRAGRSGLKVRTANKQGYDIATDGDGVDLSYPQSKTRRGRVGHGVSKTLMGADSMGTVDNYRIRKLTPKECWRLMGFDDEDFRKAEQVNSNTQLYKQAGNSIVVNVLEAILKNLLEKEE